MNWLTLLGKIDGGIAALAAVYGTQVDPTHLKVALLVGGVAGGVGVVLNVISHYLGGGDVAPVPSAGGGK
jgi:hypothetical protein